MRRQGVLSPLPELRAHPAFRPLAVERPLPSALKTTCPARPVVSLRRFPDWLVPAWPLRCHHLSDLLQLHLKLSLGLDSTPPAQAGWGHARSELKGSWVLPGPVQRSCHVWAGRARSRENVAGPSRWGPCLFRASGQRGAGREMWVDSGASLMARPVQNQDGPVMEARRVPGLEDLPSQELGDGGGLRPEHMPLAGWPWGRCSPL